MRNPAFHRYYRLPWRLLIVGCGDVGLRLIRRLRASHPASRIAIVATARRAEQQDAIRMAGAVPLRVDLDQRHEAARIAALGRRAVISAPPSEGGGTRDLRTRSLVAAWTSSRPKRTLPRFGAPPAGSQGTPGVAPGAFVYLSTTGVFGDHGGAWIDECAPALPGQDRSRRRLDAEQQWRTRLGAARLRIPGIYAQDRLPLERLAQGLPCVEASDDSYTNHIHAEDLAQIAWLALFRAKRGRQYVVVDDEPLPMGEWFDAIAKTFGLASPPRLARAQVRAQVSPMMWSFMRESRRLRNLRMRKELRPQLLAARARDYLLSLPTRC